MYEEDMDLKNENLDLNADNTNQEEVEPVAMSKKQTGFIVIGSILFLIIILYMLRGCSISKDVGSSTKNQEVVNTQSEISTSGVSNGGESSSQNLENTTENVEVSSTSSGENNLVENTNSSESTQSTSTDNTVKDIQAITEVPTSSTDDLFEKDTNMVVVTEPQLGDVVSTQGIVKSKSVYSFNGSYIYNVDILLISEDSTVKSCSYFCPKKTYDALYVSQSLSVSYQLDSKGNISICTISN